MDGLSAVIQIFQQFGLVPTIIMIIYAEFRLLKAFKAFCKKHCKNFEWKEGE